MFGYGNWQQVEDNGDGTEVHELIISKDEVKKDAGDDSESSYLISRIAKKANQLGSQNRKVLEVEYKRDSDGDWVVKFTCEKDWH